MKLNQLIPFALSLLILSLLSGCASMSKKECLNADWQAIGYRDGARGVHYSTLSKHRESCSEYNVIPDDGAYRAGWDEGIRRYCSADTGYRVGSSGHAYNNICPADVAEDFLSGWRQGIREFCTADNGLRTGLAGRGYNGSCPADLAPAFKAYYNLGKDVRRARSNHERIEKRLEQQERLLATQTSPRAHEQYEHQYEALLRDEARADAELQALQACMQSDWYEAGFRDGEAGRPQRAGDIGNVCGRYGIHSDWRGYASGWMSGAAHYCTYEIGLYIGQSNLTYTGVCSGYSHQQFWRGYEEGRHHYQSGNYRHQRPTRITPPARERDEHDDHERHAPSQGNSNGFTRYAKPYVDPAPAPAQSSREKPAHTEKPVHDNRDREMRQPPEHSNAATPAKEVHDNRDKLKNPMPEKSQKDKAKSKNGKDGKDDERENSDKENGRH